MKKVTQGQQAPRTEYQTDSLEQLYASVARSFMSQVSLYKLRCMTRPGIRKQWWSLGPNGMANEDA